MIPTPLPQLARLQGALVTSQRPSPALTFWLLGVRSLSKETTRNFTGKGN